MNAKFRWHYISVWSIVDTSLLIFILAKYCTFVFGSNIIERNNNFITMRISKSTYCYIHFYVCLPMNVDAVVVFVVAVVVVFCSKMSKFTISCTFCRKWFNNRS